LDKDAAHAAGDKADVIRDGIRVCKRLKEIIKKKSFIVAGCILCPAPIYFRRRRLH